MGSYRPPHSELDVIFSSSKEADRKIRANERYREKFNEGRAFRDGQRSR